MCLYIFVSQSYLHLVPSSRSYSSLDFRVFIQSVNQIIRRRGKAVHKTISVNVSWVFRPFTCRVGVQTDEYLELCSHFHQACQPLVSPTDNNMILSQCYEDNHHEQVMLQCCNTITTYIIVSSIKKPVLLFSSYEPSSNP